jgi:hypothetical protein
VRGPAVTRRVCQLLLAAVLLSLFGCSGTAKPAKITEPTPTTRFPGKR